MMYRTAPLSLSLITLTGNALAAQSAALPPALQPMGPWNVEYAESMCVLQRHFGAGDKTVTLGFKPSPASDGMTMVVITQGRVKKAGFGTARIAFDNETPIEATHLSYSPPGKDTTVSMIYLKRSDLTPLGAARSLQVQADKISVSLVPARAAAAFKALGTCEDDLLVRWGMDPKIVAQIAQYPSAGSKGTAAFFLNDDYPSSALRNNEQGTAGARIRVGTNGLPTECVIVETSGSKTLDDATCNILRGRARFQPARLKDGKPVESFTYSRIRWVIPS